MPPLTGPRRGSPLPLSRPCSRRASKLRLEGRPACGCCCCCCWSLLPLERKGSGPLLSPAARAALVWLLVLGGVLWCKLVAGSPVLLLEPAGLPLPALWAAPGPCSGALVGPAAELPRAELFEGLPGLPPEEPRLLPDWPLPWGAERDKGGAWLEAAGEAAVGREGSDRLCCSRGCEGGSELWLAAGG